MKPMNRLRTTFSGLMKARVLPLLIGLLCSAAASHGQGTIYFGANTNHFVEVATSTFDASNQTNVNATKGYFQKLPFPNVITDAEGLWDKANFWYTAPEDGQYVIITILRPQDNIGDGKRYGQGAGLTAGDGPTYLWTRTNPVSNGSFNQRIMTLTAGQKVYMNYSLDNFDSYLQAGMTIYKL